MLQADLQGTFRLFTPPLSKSGTNLAQRSVTIEKPKAKIGSGHGQLGLDHYRLGS